MTNFTDKTNSGVAYSNRNNANVDYVDKDRLGVYCQNGYYCDTSFYCIGLGTLVTGFNNNTVNYSDRNNNSVNFTDKVNG